MRYSKELTLIDNKKGSIMKIVQLIRNICLQIFLISQLTILSIYANTMQEFVTSSKAFIGEGNVFKGESKRLLDNTTEMENALLELEKALSEPHKTTQNLKKLDKGLSTIRNILTSVSIIPQIRSKVELLISRIDNIYNPVHSMFTQMQKVDKAIEPLQKVTHNAEKANAKILNAEQSFRHGNLLYIDKVGKGLQCLHGPFMINLLNHSRTSYNIVDKKLKQVNDDYDTAKNIPEELMTSLIKEIREILKINGILHDINVQLENLYNPLKNVQYILSKKVSIALPYTCGIKTCTKTEPYPCGVKTCSKRESYPCGVKTCSKHTFLGTTHYPCGTKTCHHNVDYPCGTKICHKNVNYPCGTKTCHVSISLSVEDILHGADAIEAKIKSLLSSVVWEGLKDVGLKSYIKKLQEEANSLLNSALAQLHLDINMNLPKVSIIEIQKLEQLMQDLELFISKIEKLEQEINLQYLLPNVNYMELKQFYLDIDTKLPECIKQKSKIINSNHPLSQGIAHAK